jgi:PAS domain S-box-containing protein
VTQGSSSARTLFDHDDQTDHAPFEQAIDFAVVAIDRDGRVTSWNAGAERMFGWSAEDMCGQPLSHCSTPEDLAGDRIGADMRQTLLSGRAGGECWHVRKDGTRFWAASETILLLDAGGSHRGFIKILHDRTRDRQAMEAQRADAEFLRGVLASSGDCIKVLDLEARLTFMSEGGQRVMEVADF